MGLLDFAGGTVVHITAGCWRTGRRTGTSGNRKGFPQQAMPPHNLTMTVTGAGMLWVGWFGFNGGSALAANGDAGMAMLVTHISAAAGALAWMTMEWIKFGKPSVLGIVTGMVAGLGTITPRPLALLAPAAHWLLALVPVLFVTTLLRRSSSAGRSMIPSMYSRFTVWAAYWARFMRASSLLMLWGVFSGQGYNEGMNMISQVQVQLVGIAATFVYTGIVTFILLKLIDKVLVLRIDEESETSGLDLVEHNERG